MIEQKITKTIKTFRAPNGQLYEGTSADYYEGRRKPFIQAGGSSQKDDLVGVGKPDSVPAGIESEDKKKEQ